MILTDITNEHDKKIPQSQITITQSKFIVRLERVSNLSSTIIWASSQEILILLLANSKGAPLRDIVVVAFLLILMNRLNQTQYVVFKSENVGSLSF